jgi:exodeoxyribonuclease VII large subunit
LLAAIQSLGLRSLRTVRRYFERSDERYNAIAQRFPERSALLAPQTQRVDDLSERLKRGLGLSLAKARGDLAHASGALRPALLEQRVNRSREKLDQLWRVAASLNPDLVLKRGYARVEKRGGGTVMTATEARAASALSLRFADDAVDVRVERAAAPAKEKPEQGSLL